MALAESREIRKRIQIPPPVVGRNGVIAIVPKDDRLYTSTNVMAALKVQRSKARSIIRDLQQEMIEAGRLYEGMPSGRIPKWYFEKRCGTGEVYGVEEVQQILGLKRSKAYEVMKGMKKKMIASGKLYAGYPAGKIPKEYFEMLCGLVEV